MAKKTDKTVPKTKADEQPKDKGGRPKGRKTKPVALRVRDKVLKQINKKPDSWWDKLSDNSLIQLLKRVLPASGPVEMPQDEVDKDLNVKVQYIGLKFDHPFGYDAGNVSDTDDPNKPKAEQPEAAPDLPQTVAPSEPVKPDLSLLTGGDLIAAVQVNPDSDEAKALWRMVDEAAERLLDERIAKEETAKEFSERMYRARQKRNNQRRMMVDGHGGWTRIDGGNDYPVGVEL